MSLIISLLFLFACLIVFSIFMNIFAGLVFFILKFILPLFFFLWLMRRIYENYQANKHDYR